MMGRNCVESWIGCGNFKKLKIRLDFLIGFLYVSVCLVSARCVFLSKEVLYMIAT